MSQMLTAAEVQDALEAGDHYCRNCGYRKSLHGDKHPTKHLRNGGCTTFSYGVFFNEAVLDDDWVREQKQLKRQQAKARKTARGAA